MLYYIYFLKSKETFFLSEVEEEMYKVVQHNKALRMAKFWGPEGLSICPKYRQNRRLSQGWAFLVCLLLLRLAQEMGKLHMK